MEIFNGSIVLESGGVRHTVASFLFDGLEPGLEFVAFGVQFLDAFLWNLVGYKVPVRCDIDPVAVDELGEYDATIIVVVPDVDWIARLWPVMVYLSELLSNALDSGDTDLIAWATYEEVGV